VLLRFEVLLLLLLQLGAQVALQQVGIVALAVLPAQVVGRRGAGKSTCVRAKYERKHANVEERSTLRIRGGRQG
jgi:hypothetical protein